MVTDDGAAVVAHLSANPPADYLLQHAGDGALLALAQHTPGAEEVAWTVLRTMFDRAWKGDRELSLELGAALGLTPEELWTELRGGPAEVDGGDEPELRALPVDLDELAEMLEGDPTYGGGRIDLRTGQTWPKEVLESLTYDGAGSDDEGEDEEGGDDEAGDDEDRWLWVGCQGSRDGYDDMVDFVETVKDPRLIGRLEVALDGRGAFRRFRNVLDREPAEFERWQAFSDDRRRGRARKWLAREGYRSVPKPR
jgi:hypothetical protein